MKRFLLSLLLAWVWLAPAVAGDGRRLRNNPLPERPDTLRILGVGNSFTDDGMIYLPDLLRKAGVGPVVLGRLYFGGCSLEQHCRFYEEGTSRYAYYKTTDNRWQTVSERASLTDALRDGRWDIIVVQQASAYSGLYDSYSPFLENLLRIILHHADNPRLCLAWQMTWAYASDSTHGGFKNYDNDQQVMYAGIIDATRRMVRNQGVDVVIPSGTTIQNLRAHGTPSRQEFTRDGFHLDLGVGRYAAACAWYEALIAPIYGGSVVGNPLRIETPGGKSTPVTDAVAADCQRAARLAVKRPYRVTEWTSAE